MDFRARPIIAPNLGFWRQMIEWEDEHNGGKTTVKLLKGMKTPVPDVYLQRSEIFAERLSQQEASRRSIGNRLNEQGGKGMFFTPLTK